MKYKYFMVTGTQVLLLTFLVFGFSIFNVNGQKFHVVEKQDGITIIENEKPVLFFRKMPLKVEGKHEKAGYIHPLYDLKGNVMTEDMPADHPYHRGIFTAWKQIMLNDSMIANGWTSENISYKHDTTYTYHTENSVTLKAEYTWNAILENVPTSIMEEHTRITVHRSAPHYRAIDYDTRLFPQKKNISIGGSDDEKGYGGFSLRLKLPENVSFRSQNKEITPEVNAVNAGPWMNITGSFSDDSSLKSGIVIFGYMPGNESRHSWILRKKASMQNVPFPGRTPVPVPAEGIRLYYRIIVHDGTLTNQQIENLYETFSSRKDTAHLESAQLKAVVANNNGYGKYHEDRYNGVSELYIKGGDGKNLFVPVNSGLNFEHIYNGELKFNSANIFEPRLAPMELHRISDNKVELRQYSTSTWPLKSSITYELNGNSIDFVYTGTPLKDVWKNYGYIGVFFASYINAPRDKGIHFIGRKIADGEHGKAYWIYNLPEAHGVQGNHRPFSTNWYPPIDTAGFRIGLVKGFSDYAYEYPFYYGIYGDNVFIMMFEESDKAGQLNFAQSPDGAGPLNPAWDFAYHRRKYKVGKPFSFKARAVYKKFEGRDDVVRIYEEWSGKKVKL